MRKILLYGILSFGLMGAMQAQNTDAPRPRPQFQHDPYNPMVHDPVLAKEGDTYYLFCTGRGVSRFSSKDLKKWDRMSPCFADIPESVTKAFAQAQLHLWAPDIIYHNGLWHLTYSCSAFAKNTSVIGHATSPTLDPESPDYKWTDCGVLVQSVPNRDEWNAIDSNIIVDETGKPWMNFGSFWGGIKMVQLTEDMNAVAQPEEWRTLARRPRSFKYDDTNPGDAAIEAPFIYKHGDWYYLLVSFDYCCRGNKSDYKVAVGRSQSVEGPFLDKEGKSLDMGGGTVILEGEGEKWAAVGHCAAYTIDGQDIFIAHAYAKDNGQSKLIVRPISWEEEWPVVKW